MELLWDIPNIPVTEPWDGHYGCAPCERTTSHDVVARNVTSVILLTRCRACCTERIVNTLYLI
jgi:hypothetical protein